MVLENIVVANITTNVTNVATGLLSDVKLPENITTNATNVVTGLITGTLLPAITSGGVTSVFVFAVFIMFVVMAKKVWGMVKNIVFISIASVAFPFVVNFSGIASVPTSFESIAFFVVIGVGAYLVFTVIHMILKISNLFGDGKKVI
ncbi:MAG: hypothetical protein ABIA21_03930, partial [Candidatus Aenigmatarchaeota archaeon]